MSKRPQIHLLTPPRAAGGAYKGRTADGESESPPTATLMRAGRSRRMTSMSLAAVAGVVLGTAASTPAMASTSPSIAETTTSARRPHHEPARVPCASPHPAAMAVWPQSDQPMSADRLVPGPAAEPGQYLLPSMPGHACVLGYGQLPGKERSCLDRASAPKAAR
jgi:hypothetical protein